MIVISNIVLIFIFVHSAESQKVNKECYNLCPSQCRHFTIKTLPICEDGRCQCLSKDSYEIMPLSNNIVDCTSADDCTNVCIIRGSDRAVCSNGRCICAWLDHNKRVKRVKRHDCYDCQSKCKRRGFLHSMCSTSKVCHCYFHLSVMGYLAANDNTQCQLPRGMCDIVCSRAGFERGFCEQQDCICESERNSLQTAITMEDNAFCGFIGSFCVSTCARERAVKAVCQNYRCQCVHNSALTESTSQTDCQIPETLCQSLCQKRGLDDYECDDTGTCNCLDHPARLLLRLRDEDCAYPDYSCDGICRTRGFSRSFCVGDDCACIDQSNYFVMAEKSVEGYPLSSDNPEYQPREDDATLEEDQPNSSLDYDGRRPPDVGVPVSARSDRRRFQEPQYDEPQIDSPSYRNKLERYPPGSQDRRRFEETQYDEPVSPPAIRNQYSDQYDIPDEEIYEEPPEEYTLNPDVDIPLNPPMQDYNSNEGEEYSAPYEPYDADVMNSNIPFNRQRPPLDAIPVHNDAINEPVHYLGGSLGGDEDINLPIPQSQFSRPETLSNRIQDRLPVPAYGQNNAYYNYDDFYQDLPSTNREIEYQPQQKGIRRDRPYVQSNDVLTQRNYNDNPQTPLGEDLSGQQVNYPQKKSAQQLISRPIRRKTLNSRLSHPPPLPVNNLPKVSYFKNNKVQFLPQRITPQVVGPNNRLPFKEQQGYNSLPSNNNDYLLYDNPIKQPIQRQYSKVMIPNPLNLQNSLNPSSVRYAQFKSMPIDHTVKKYISQVNKAIDVQNQNLRKYFGQDNPEMNQGNAQIIYDSNGEPIHRENQQYSQRPDERNPPKIISSPIDVKGSGIKSNPVRNSENSSPVYSNSNEQYAQIPDQRNPPRKTSSPIAEKNSGIQSIPFKQSGASLSTGQSPVHSDNSGAKQPLKTKSNGINKPGFNYIPVGKGNGLANKVSSAPDVPISKHKVPTNNGGATSGTSNSPSSKTNSGSGFNYIPVFKGKGSQNGSPGISNALASKSPDNTKSGTSGINYIPVSKGKASDSSGNYKPVTKTSSPVDTGKSGISFVPVSKKESSAPPVNTKSGFSFIPVSKGQSSAPPTNTKPGFSFIPVSKGQSSGSPEKSPSGISYLPVAKPNVPDSFVAEKPITDSAETPQKISHIIKGLVAKPLGNRKPIGESDTEFVPYLKPEQLFEIEKDDESDEKRPSSIDHTDDMVSPNMGSDSLESIPQKEGYNKQVEPYNGPKTKFVPNSQSQPDKSEIKKSASPVTKPDSKDVQIPPSRSGFNFIPFGKKQNEVSQDKKQSSSGSSGISYPPVTKQKSDNKDKSGIQFVSFNKDSGKGAETMSSSFGSSPHGRSSPRYGHAPLNRFAPSVGQSFRNQQHYQPAIHSNIIDRRQYRPNNQFSPSMNFVSGKNSGKKKKQKSDGDETSKSMSHKQSETIVSSFKSQSSNKGNPESQLARGNDSSPADDDDGIVLVSMKRTSKKESSHSPGSGDWPKGAVPVSSEPVEVKDHSKEHKEIIKFMNKGIEERDEFMNDFDDRDNIIFLDKRKTADNIFSPPSLPTYKKNNKNNNNNNNNFQDFQPFNVPRFDNMFNMTAFFPKFDRTMPFGNIPMPQFDEFATNTFMNPHSFFKNFFDDPNHENDEAKSRKKRKTFVINFQPRKKQNRRSNDVLFNTNENYNRAL